MSGGYLLDTNAWIALLKGHPAVAARARAAGPAALWLCAPVWAELCFGALNSQRVTTNLERLRQLQQAVPMLPLDAAAAERVASLRLELQRRGEPIGPYDLQIAAIAGVRDLVLVTRNVREFGRVPGLQVENWQDEPPTAS